MERGPPPPSTNISRPSRGSRPPRGPGRRPAEPHPGYHRAVVSIARSLHPAGRPRARVGCGTGDLLAALEPSVGVGVDLSRKCPPGRGTPPGSLLPLDAGRAVVTARPDLRLCDPLRSSRLPVRHPRRAEARGALSHPGTRIVINWYSRLWQPVIHLLLDRLGLKASLPYINWTTVEDVENPLRLADSSLCGRARTSCCRSGSALSSLANRFLVHLPVLRWFAWTSFRCPPVSARPRPPRASRSCVRAATRRAISRRWSGGCPLSAPTRS